MSAAQARHYTVAVLLPCLNEGPVIGATVAAFYEALPDAHVYVYDNASDDDTAAQAQARGAQVIHVPQRGKGHVVARMLTEIEADIYILCDGDGTYPPELAPTLVGDMIRERLDMVVGARSPDSISRSGHRFGNRVISRIFASLFKQPITDLLSGYRVMSRRFVKSFPNVARGFEVETMLTAHAIELTVPMKEVPCPYRERAEGTASKLNTVQDGTLIFGAILLMFKELKPLVFFGVGSLILLLTGLGFGIPVIVEYLHTGLVERFPTAILATGLVVLSAIFATAGMVLDTVARNYRSIKRILYQQCAPYSSP